MPSCLIVGGGLAGLACAAALADSGFRVTVVESRPYPGGRATSYRVPGAGEIDNCQHVLLRCCTNLLDFYERLGVQSNIEFHRDFYFIEPGGQVSEFRAGILPAPLHFSGAFMGLKCLGLKDKLAIARAMLSIRTQRRRPDLDAITMMDWLREKRQTERAIERFWRQILVSAVNEELDRMAAAHGLQVMWLGFLATGNSYEMGVPNVRLGDLYHQQLWRSREDVSFRFARRVNELAIADGRVRRAVTDDGEIEADYFVSAVPFEAVGALSPAIHFDPTGWGHSPIAGIHFWFDRPVTDLPHGTLLDRTIQWFFNKDGGRYLQVVVSASRSLAPMKQQEVVDLTLRELAEFLPLVKDAKLMQSRVVKEIRATFSARPGLEAERPGPETEIPNLFLAGDWTKTGWPSTMEGAVRSGYLAAEAVVAATGGRQRFLAPEVA
jgi:squalene-associated FAD-dependent desaturase